MPAPAQFRVASFCWLVVLGLVATRSLAGNNDRPLSQPAVAFDRNSETLLVSYLEIAPELAEQDRTPLVRIYGDGTLRVHRPVNTLGAGSYEARLDEDELHRLLLLSAGALDGFDPRAVRETKREAERARVEATLTAGETPVFHGVADDSISVFELHLRGYRPAGATFFLGEFHREVSWMGVATDAERFPGVEAIRQLREVELALLALLDRDDLARTRE